MTTKRCPTCNLDKPTFRGPRCADCKALYKKTRSEEAATAIVEIPQVIWPKDPEGRLKVAVELRMAAYKERAIDAIFELATMAPSDNPLLMQVKLAAAAKLAGPLPGDAQAGSLAGKQTELDPFLKELSDAFKAQRPRLLEVRERVAVFEQPSGATLPAE